MLFLYKKLNDELKKQFGTKVYKISISSGLSCPNRDGKCGDRGCIFCGQKGAGEFTSDSSLSISDQIETAKLRVSKKIKSGKYIAYFQSFTNTYGDIEYLRKIFYKAIEKDDIVALSIATRPDCLGKNVLDLLAEINKVKPVWIELGLQTIHQKTADYIRRGYPLSIYEKAVKDLKNIGVTVITHMIIGLPNESEKMIIETAKYIGNLTDGIKFHMLYVAKDTDLEKEYKKGNIKLLSMEEYIYLLSACIKVLPKSVIVHRITGDPDKKTLIAPMWTADKKKVLNSITKYFKENKIQQGSNL